MRERFGIPDVGSHRRFVLALTIDALGSGVFGPVAMLYYLAVSNVSLARIGLAISISAAIAMPLVLVVGHLVDQVGARRILLVSNLIQAVAYIGALWATSFVGILVVTTTAAVGQACFWGSYSPTVAEISHAGERELWFGFIGALRNLGLALGGLLAGIAVAVGTHTAYHLVVIANAISYLAAFGLLASEGAASRARPVRSSEDKSHWAVALRDRDYRLVVGANLLYAVASLALTYAMPVYAVHVLALPGWLAGAVYIVNTVIVAFGQGIVVANMRGHVRRNIVIAGNVAFAAGFVIMAIAGRVSVSAAVVAVLLGTAVYTFGEVLCGPPLTTIAVDSRPAAVRGRYLGLYQVSWNVAGIVAPAGFAWLLEHSVTGVWWVLIAVTVLGALMTALMARRLPVAREVVTNAA